MNEAPTKSSSGRLFNILFLGVGIGIGWFVAKAPEIIQGKPPEVLPANPQLDGGKSTVAAESPF